MEEKGPITIGRVGDKKASDILMERVINKAKTIKLTVPFMADGFRSEKTPTQPDGVTPVVVESISAAKPQPKPVETETKDEIKMESKYTKEYLTSLKMSELQKIGKKFNIKDNIKAELIDKILKVQK